MSVYLGRVNAIVFSDAEAIDIGKCVSVVGICWCYDQPCGFCLFNLPCFIMGHSKLIGLHSKRSC